MVMRLRTHTGLILANIVVAEPFKIYDFKNSKVKPLVKSSTVKMGGCCFVGSHLCQEIVVGWARRPAGRSPERQANSQGAAVWEKPPNGGFPPLAPFPLASRPKLGDQTGRLAHQVKHRGSPHESA